MVTYCNCNNIFIHFILHPNRIFWFSPIFVCCSNLLKDHSAFFAPYLMTCRWYMFAESQIYPRRHAFFVQFTLIFCSCCGTALCGVALVDDAAQLWTFFWPLSSGSWGPRLSKASQQIRPHSVVPTRLPGLVFRRHSRCFRPRPSCVCLSCLPKTFQPCSPPVKHVPSPALLLWSGWTCCGAPLLRLQRIWQLRCRRRAHRGRTDRHRHNRFMMLCDDGLWSIKCEHKKRLLCFSFSLKYQQWKNFSSKMIGSAKHFRGMRKLKQKL